LEHQKLREMLHALAVAEALHDVWNILEFTEFTVKNSRECF
jgi:hypothetical protein